MLEKILFIGNIPNQNPDTPRKKRVSMDSVPNIMQKQIKSDNQSEHRIKGIP